MQSSTFYDLILKIEKRGAHYYRNCLIREDEVRTARKKGKPRGDGARRGEKV